MTFPIRITNDDALELTEEFSLTLFIPDVSKRLGVLKGARSFATGRIMNNDGNGINIKVTVWYKQLLYDVVGASISWSTDTALVTEGVNMSISLVLNRVPGVPFTVTVNSSNINTTGFAE